MKLSHTVCAVCCAPNSIGRRLLVVAATPVSTCFQLVLLLLLLLFINIYYMYIVVFVLVAVVTFLPLANSRTFFLMTLSFGALVTRAYEHTSITFVRASHFVSHIQESSPKTTTKQHRIVLHWYQTFAVLFYSRYSTLLKNVALGFSFSFGYGNTLKYVLHTRMYVQVFFCCQQHLLFAA